MFFIAMEIFQIDELMVEKIELQSGLLDRTVRIDFYQPYKDESITEYSLLLVNDGQDLLKMGFEEILKSLSKNLLKPLLVAGIHCGEDRKK